ncbi:LOW QUALITY PROTEIN: hypothetical protein MAR_005802 [Mya arenaria]|uniref:DUF4371 domain-containing protein n=1 Tax=Mya arenaria TaxID=6604 RepID=A0ABY7F0I7_MYAAR|nr:LOW QUALITY PROTEIN: hypothetical protein MAR_005802 [Mya arenaria]
MNFLVEHNLPYLVADHPTALVKKAFPDSAIAQKYSCKRTKSTHIQSVEKLCRENMFRIMIDESNDRGDNKLLAVLVRMHDNVVQRVKTRILGIPICDTRTRKHIFSTLNQLTVCAKNSMSHLANICVGDAVKSLPLPVEDLLVDVYFHFQKSMKCKETLRSFQEFTDTEPSKSLSNTRWLSLEHWVVRLLDRWRVLRSYFESHDESENGRLTSDQMWFYYAFLKTALVLLSDFNKQFQMIMCNVTVRQMGVMDSEIRRLLRSVLGKFVQMKVILAASDITKVDFTNSLHQHEYNNIAVGWRACQFLDEHDVAPYTTEKLFRSCSLSILSDSGKVHFLGAAFLSKERECFNTLEREAGDYLVSPSGRNYPWPKSLPKM